MKMRNMVETDALEIFVLSGTDNVPTRLRVENLRVSVGEWVEQWPDSIFFYAWLVTNLEEL